MIYYIVAALLREDALVVELEGHLVGFDGDGHGLLRHGLHEGLRSSSNSSSSSSTIIVTTILIICITIIGLLVVGGDVLEAGEAAAGDASRQNFVSPTCCLLIVFSLDASWDLFPKGIPKSYPS